MCLAIVKTEAANVVKINICDILKTSGFGCRVKSYSTIALHQRSALESSMQAWGVSVIVGWTDMYDITIQPVHLISGRTWKGSLFGGEISMNIPLTMLLQFSVSCQLLRLLLLFQGLKVGMVFLRWLKPTWIKS